MTSFSCPLPAVPFWFSPTQPSRLTSQEPSVQTMMSCQCKASLESNIWAVKEGHGVDVGDQNLSGTEKVPQRTFATKILLNFRVNFLVRFASEPLFYWVVLSNYSEDSLALFVRIFGFGYFLALEPQKCNCRRIAAFSNRKVQHRKFAACFPERRKRFAEEIAVYSGGRGCVEKSVWDFQAKSGSSSSCRLFLHVLGKIAIQEMSGKAPGSSRHPSSRHPRPSECFFLGAECTHTHTLSLSLSISLSVPVSCALNLPFISLSLSLSNCVGFPVVQTDPGAVPWTEAQIIPVCLLSAIQVALTSSSSTKCRGPIPSSWSIMLLETT